MKTQKIRIGNDIRLAVDLRLYINRRVNLRERDVYNPADQEFEDIDRNPYVNKKYEVYYNDKDGCCCDWDGIEFKPEGTPVAIRTMKAILVNTSKKKELADFLKKKSRFMARFPLEPETEVFSSTPFDVRNSGDPTWRAFPYRHRHGRYHGFGLYPGWNGLYKPLPHIHKFEYQAPCMATERQNVVEVCFPAEDQMYLGKYSLIIVAKIFAPGFNEHNLKTVTIDLPDVIELVETSAEGEDNDVIGDATWIDEKLPDLEIYVARDVYVRQGDVVAKKDTTDPKESLVGDHLFLDRTDGETVDVDLSRVVSWADPDAEGIPETEETCKCEK